MADEFGTWLLDDVPSARFPTYSRGNAGEVVPNAVTPITGGLVGRGLQRVIADLFGRTGMFKPEELADPAAVAAQFGGYFYLNVSFARVMAVRIPGASIDDIDHQLLGRVEGVPPYRRQPGDRSLATTIKGIGELARTFLRPSPIDLSGDRARVLAWLETLPGPDATDAELIGVVASARSHLDACLSSHFEVSMRSMLPVMGLERLAARLVKDEPGLVLRVQSGLGGVESAEPAIEMWRMGQLVQASAVLTALFDQGVAAVEDALRQPAPGDVADFAALVGEFQERFGHRGPDEIEVASETWGTDATIILAAVERLRHGTRDLAALRASLADDRRAAIDQLRRRTPRPLRPVLNGLITRAAAGAGNREQSKGTAVLALHGVRRCLFALADRLAERGLIRERADLFLATIDELPALVAGDRDFTAELAARRERLAFLNSRVPPFIIDGEVPDPASWPSKAGEGVVAARPGEVLTGIGVCPGRARGRARVITDPSDPRGLEPGDVLVAPLTDPAWTPLFLAAEAVVVDVGAVQSHAAIVSRELGIPAVVSVTDASIRIADGTPIEVDGSGGTVTILEA